MPELAAVNGRISPIDEAKISINDRGMVFGDGVYEVIASYRGRLFLFDEHLRRLRRSLDAIRMEYVEIEPIAEQMNYLFERAALPRAKVYLQITRGTAPRDHAFPVPTRGPNVIITVREVHEIDQAKLDRGVACITHRDIRWGRVDVKTTNLLPNCLAKQAALDRGCFDAIFVSGEGIVREATSANLFAAKNGGLWTHPTDERILGGITRAKLIELARPKGIEVREEKFDVDFLLGADEVFITGTTTEVLPIINVDGRPIGGGKPGPLARRMLALLTEWLLMNVDS